jgi:hypothetical protein
MHQDAVRLVADGRTMDERNTSMSRAAAAPLHMWDFDLGIWGRCAPSAANWLDRQEEGRDTMTTIAAFGATGYSGGNVAAEALSRGRRVIAVARAPAFGVVA